MCSNRYLLVGKFLCLGLLLFCKENDLFLDNHWKLSRTRESNFISPMTCGSCHSQQLNAWTNSAHANSFRSGILWQLPKFSHSERENCYKCHLPNKMQIDEVNINLDNPKINIFRNSFLDHKDFSLSCSNCHLRNNIIYGPQPSENLKEELHRKAAPHKIKIQHEFDQSKFCANCHQNASDGKRVNNKLLMNVYEDWLESKAYKENKNCQNCHMPNRDHSFKGIHDSEFVKNGIQFQFIRFEKKIKFTLRNIHVGHKFPAYSVPRILIYVKKENRTFQLDEIGWIISLDLQNEIKDQRIQQGESFQKDYDIEEIKNLFQIKSNQLTNFAFEIWIAPRYHYGKIFSYILEKEKHITPFEKFHLQKSIDDEIKSRYLMHKTNFSF